MARSRDPFGKAVAVLKARLLTGAYGHGRPLLVSEVAAELGLSTTPVREAMARLVGEGMIEEHRGRGYMTWRMDSADLKELYELEGFYLGWAAHLCVALPAQVAGPLIDRARFELLGQGGASDPVLSPLSVRLQKALDLVVEAPGHGALKDAYERTAQRLGPAREVEGVVLAEAERECAALHETLARGTFAELAPFADAFARRRVEAAGEIASSLRRGSVSRGNI